MLPDYKSNMDQAGTQVASVCKMVDHQVHNTLHRTELAFATFYAYVLA
jgi:hypothetical protein